MDTRCIPQNVSDLGNQSFTFNSRDNLSFLPSKIWICSFSFQDRIILKVKRKQERTKSGINYANPDQSQLNMHKRTSNFWIRRIGIQDLVLATQIFVAKEAMCKHQKIPKMKENTLGAGGGNRLGTFWWKEFFEILKFLFLKLFPKLHRTDRIDYYKSELKKKKLRTFLQFFSQCL